MEIGAVRLDRAPDGALVPGERFATFVDPGREIDRAITRLTGIQDADLRGAPPAAQAVAALEAFTAGACLVGHNVAFDIEFLERSGLSSGRQSLDTVELASIVWPQASSYALQRLAADLGIDAGSAHRALDDALTCAALLAELSRAAASLRPEILEELRGTAATLGPAHADFFAGALAAALRSAWDGRAASAAAARPSRRRDIAAAERLGVATVFAAGGPLAGAFAGYEDRPEQREMALAVERTFGSGGVLVVEAGTGVGKSLAYGAPAIARALRGERTIVSTHTLPLQDQLVRRDLPALQAALGTAVPVAVLKGRSNYLCPRRWQQLRAGVATRDEARLVCKTLVWRETTAAGDRAEINLLGGEGALWSRVSADDESCTSRRCLATRPICYLERARSDADAADIVVVNHALLLHDARAGGALLPESEHVVIDEAHQLEDVAADAFGQRLESWRLARDLDRLGRSPAVLAGLRSGEQPRIDAAETLRGEVALAHERAAEAFATFRLPLAPPEERVRVTAGLRASDELWLPVELAAARLDDALAGAQIAAQRLGDLGGDEDDVLELASAAKELSGARSAIGRGIHESRTGDIVWLEADDRDVGLHVAPAHTGGAIRRTVVDRHRSVVLTSATLAVAGSLAFAKERAGVADIADELRVGSPFDPEHTLLVVPADIALPHEPDYAEHLAIAIEEAARALDGRTLALFTSHAAMRDVAARLGALDDAGIAVLTQGVDGSRRSLLERFRAGRAVLLGARSFWEGVDLPGDLLQCVVVARLPFEVPDDPLVEGRSERYDDPFREYQLPQAALRLRQGVGRLIRTTTDRGVILLCDRRILTRDYGPTLLASLPGGRARRTTLAEIGAVVAGHCGKGGHPDFRKPPRETHQALPGRPPDVESAHRTTSERR